MGFFSTVLGPGQSDYNNLANQVYQPNAGAYSNTADPGALTALQGVGQGQAALGASGVGNSGLAAQQSALQNITNMANGQGPSLAAANLNAGLNTTFQNLSNQAMSNQGNVGAGNSQRNLLNAQAAAANSVSQQAGVNSVAEQMGALQQEGAAAQGLTSAQLAQGNFQRGLLQDQGTTAQSQSAIGQMDTQNAETLDNAKNAAQTTKLGYQQQGMNAAHQQFSNALDDIGKVVNIGASIGSTIASGGTNQLAGLASGAMSGGGGGGASNATMAQQGQNATSSFNQMYPSPQPYQFSNGYRYAQ